MIGALRPQPVGEREVTIEVAHVERPDRGQLMHDHLRVRPAHRLGDLIGIERISHDRHRAELGQHARLDSLLVIPTNLMSRGHQPWHQLLTNRSRRSCNKHSHRDSLVGFAFYTY